MQNRVKFRVWDKENKCLHYPARYSNFTIVNGTVVKVESYPIANSAYLGKRIAWEFDDAVIMQCTGLKDKHGKLIYEKDIVRDIPTQAVYKVGHKKCAFYLENKEYIGYFHELSQCFSISRLEVIGNIYENPELLSEVNNDNK